MIMEQKIEKKRKKKKSVFGMTFMGDITVQGNMFDIHDNQNVYFNGEKEGEDEEEDEEDLSSYSLIKYAIINYVGKIKPLVKTEYLDCYDKMWSDILELKEVKMVVYNKGKQQDTCFNRNLIGQIIHQMIDVVFIKKTNTVLLAEYLEPEKGIDHPIRQKLGDPPANPIKKVVDAYLKTLFKS